MFINECIFLALVCFHHNFLVDRELSVVKLPMLIELMYNFQVQILLVHILKHPGQVEYILCGILNHVLGERSDLPEQIVCLHLNLNFILFSILYIQVCRQQVIQRYVVILVVG
jgi:hypothetical protein